MPGWTSSAPAKPRSTPWSAEDLVLSDLRLLHLLPHVPHLPLASVAALHEPTDPRRRQEVGRWLTMAGNSGAFAVNSGLIDRGTYGDFTGRLPGSQFLAAWLGQLASHSETNR